MTFDLLTFVVQLTMNVFFFIVRFPANIVFLKNHAATVQSNIIQVSTTMPISTGMHLQTTPENKTNIANINTIRDFFSNQPINDALNITVRVQLIILLNFESTYLRLCLIIIPSLITH